jgi:hypothetical protein
MKTTKRLRCRLNPLPTTSIIFNIICRQNENMKMTNKSHEQTSRGLKSFQHDHKNQKIDPFFSPNEPDDDDDGC